MRDPLNTGEGKGHPQTNTLGEQNIRDDEISEETHDEDGTHDEYDQDSSISFDDDDEDSTASEEDNPEGWIGRGKRITEEADEQMLTYNITNWVETQRKLKRRQALRIATPNPDRWTRKAAEWNLGLIISTKDSMESRKTSQEMGRRPE